MALGLPTLLVQEGGYALKHIGRCAVALLAAAHLVRVLTQNVILLIFLFRRGVV